MEKIPTLFLRDSNDMRLVTRDVNPDAAWVLAGEGTPTIKKDGTNIRVTVKDEKVVHVEKRRNPTRQEKALGAEPGYVDAHRDDPQDKYIFAAVENSQYIGWPDGSYPCEALGPKIQGGVESPYPVVYNFTLSPTPLSSYINPRTFGEIMHYLACINTGIEGIVWHHPDGRKAKIKRKDFGLPWPLTRDPGGDVKRC